MPRTKRPTKKPEKLLEGGETLKKLDKLVADQKKKIDERIHMEVRNLELAFKILIGAIPKQHLHMTIGQLKNELLLKEVTDSRGSQYTARSGSHDDGYITENSQGSGGHVTKMVPPKSVSRPASARRSRSANACARAAPSAGSATSSARPAPRRRSRSVYRTPAYNKNAPVAYAPITPKVAPNTALTVLRQPRQGEMVVSMTGSPVMVPNYSTMQPDEKANCNILLQDGTMLSLQPKQLRESQAYIPFSLMDSNVLSQLETLKDNLEKMVKAGQRAFK